MRCTSLLTVILGLVLLAQPALGCPACKDSIAGGDSSATAGGDTDGSGANVSSGFNLSIYLMFAGLFGMIGLVSVTLIRGARGVGEKPAAVPVITPNASGPVPLDYSNER